MKSIQQFPAAEIVDRNVGGPTLQVNKKNVALAIVVGLWIVAAAFTWFPILGSILRVLAFSVTLVAVATGFGAVILSWWRSRPKKNAVAV